MAESARSAVDEKPSVARGRGCLDALLSPVRLLRAVFRQATNGLRSIPYEYESVQRVLGVPVLSVNIGFDNPAGKMRHAKGIIALGNQASGGIAVGLFAARGIVAVAPVALGLGAVGVASVAAVSVSVVGLGIVSVSVFAAGVVAVGIVSLGIYSVGILAIGRSAVGLVAFGQTIRSLFGP